MSIIFEFFSKIKICKCYLDIIGFYLYNINMVKIIIGGNKGMNKKFTSIVLVVLLILSSFSFAFAQDAETAKITVIHTNDTHSRLAPKLK